jgi:drug/metabolite transporter (DMT)-like permease
MTAPDALRLILLSAIWGASFLFMRIAVPEFGPIPLVFVRVGGAALLFVPLLLRKGNRKVVRAHAVPLLVQGFFNSALPFVLLAWAVIDLEAGFTSLLNASTPIFTAVIAFAWLRLPLNRAQILGLLLGVAGIAILAGNRFSFRGGGSGWEILAVLAATFSYGVAGNYAKVRLAGVDSLVVSGGSLAASSLLTLPLAIWWWPEQAPGVAGIACGVALAVICTALAFFLFFDILSRTGATAAATVTFVIPIFGVLWGSLFLGEAITTRMVTGMAVALLGTALVTRLLPRSA